MTNPEITSVRAVSMASYQKNYPIPTSAVSQSGVLRVNLSR